MLILSTQRTTGGYEEGICWISFQYDGNDNRPTTGAKKQLLQYVIKTSAYLLKICLLMQGGIVDKEGPYL